MEQVLGQKIQEHSFSQSLNVVSIDKILKYFGQIKNV